MINKKLVGTALVGLMTVGFAGQAFAQTDNADGTTNVDGKKGENSGKMEVRGNLGEIDNENPETPLPEESDEWINVTFPTSTIFSQGENDTIKSPVYTMRNNSGRHVKVNVTEYNIDDKKSDAKAVEALKELKLYEPGGEQMSILLAQDGASAINPAANSLGKLQTKDTIKFAFGGQVGDTSEVGKDAFIESHVVFKFQALPKEGNEK